MNKGLIAEGKTYKELKEFGLFKLIITYILFL